MTVAALPPSINYIENGVTLAFAAPFRFLPGSIDVSRVNVDGSVVALTLGIHFTTTGGDTDDGGTVTLLATVAGAKLRIRRNTPRNQAMDYTPHDDFPAESHEGALDRAMLIDQEQDTAIADIGARALRVPDGESLGDLPARADRANVYPFFNQDGDLTFTPGPGGGAVVFATTPEAQAGVSATKVMAPARVRDFVEDATITLDAMANPETLAAIINRTGLTPQMCGALSTDANHSPVINTAIDRLISAGAGTLWLPPMAGDWKIGSTINCHKAGYTGSYLKIKGAGDKAKLKWLNSTGDMIAIGDGINPVYYVDLEDLYLYAGGAARTSGIDILLRKANVCNLRNIITDGSYAGIQGVDLNSVYGSLIQINMPNQTSGRGVYVFSDPAGSGRTDIVKFDELTVQAHNAGSYGMVVEGRVAGVHTDGAYFLGCRRGLELTSTGTSIADIPNFCDFRKLEVDRALDIGVVIERAYRTEFSRCDISNTSGAMDVPYPQGSADDCAFYIGPTYVEDTKIIGGRIGNCRSQAIQVHGKNTKCIGTSFTDMAKNSGGSFQGVYLGPNADGFNFSQCTVEGFGRATHAFGIDPAAKNGVIRDTLYKGMVTGYTNGTGTNVDNTGQKLVTY